MITIILAKYDRRIYLSPSLTLNTKPVTQTFLHRLAHCVLWVCLSLVTLQRFTDNFSMIPPVVFDIKWKRIQQTMNWHLFWPEDGSKQKVLFIYLFYLFTNLYTEWPDQHKNIYMLQWYNTKYFIIKASIQNKLKLVFLMLSYNLKYKYNFIAVQRRACVSAS